jgi:hypothetical protein
MLNYSTRSALLHERAELEPALRVDCMSRFQRSRRFVWTLGKMSEDGLPDRACISIQASRAQRLPPSRFARRLVSRSTDGVPLVARGAASHDEIIVCQRCLRIVIDDLAT